MHMSSPRPVVHLELHTGDHARASAFYAKLLCWRQELIEAGSGSYLGSAWEAVPFRRRSAASSLSGSQNHDDRA